MTILAESQKGRDVFRCLMGDLFPGVNKQFCNPFTGSEVESCYIYFNNALDMYLFLDIEMGVQWDCFEFTGKTLGISPTTSVYWEVVIRHIQNRLRTSEI